MRLSRLLLWALLIAGVLTIVAPLVAWFFPIQLPDGQLLFAVGLLIDLHLVMAVVCAVVLEQGVARGWVRSGMIASAVSILAWVIVLTTYTMFPYLAGQRFAIWPTTWACLMVLVGLLMLPRSHGSLGRKLRTTSIVLGALLGASYCLSYTFHPGYTSTAYPVSYDIVRIYDMITERLVTSLALLTGGAVVLTFLSLPMRRLLGNKPAVGVVKPLWFECPRCGHPQDGLTGGCSCTECGLKVLVRLA